MQLMILGSGTSHGIPVLGCQCDVCQSFDPRDKRMRSSVYIEGNNGCSAVIDTGPEFRLQAIRAHINHLDAIFLTHSHADHLHGLDDIRPLCFYEPMPVYANASAVNDVKERFSYIFKESQEGGGKPKISLFVAENTVKLNDLEFTPVPVKHGDLDVLGWKISEGSKSIVYLTDIKSIPNSSLCLIQEPDIAVIGGLRMSSHSTHFNFFEAFETAVQIRAKRLYITHICHDYTHKEIDVFCQNLKKERNIDIIIEPAFDGQVLVI